MSKVIGIDLGTTNSCVSIMEGGDPNVITNSDGTVDPSTGGIADCGPAELGLESLREIERHLMDGRDGTANGRNGMVQHGVRMCCGRGRDEHNCECKSLQLVHISTPLDLRH